MSGDTTMVRHGDIDAIGPLAAFDVLAFAGGADPWSIGYLDNGFGADAAYFRRGVDRWGFRGLGRIADIGCGYGRWAAFLAEGNDEVVGFERNAKGVALARRFAGRFKLPNLRYTVADFRRLPAPAATFDGAWCCNVLHLTDRGRLLREMNRILRPGGRLAITEFNGAGMVLRKLIGGFRQGNLNYDARFAVRCLKNGPFHNGEDNYGSAEAAPVMLAAFGFDLEGAIETTIRAKSAPANDLGDLAVLARRIETDPAFASDFVRRPEVADGLPRNIAMAAIKTRDLEP